MKNKHLKLGLLLPLTMVMVRADDGDRMFMRVVVKNEIIVDATMDNARAIVDAAKRDGKKMCQKYAQADGVVGASTEAYDETIRRCEECMGLDMMDADLMDSERCGCNKPKPRSMESECYGMDRCGCNKPKPKAMNCDEPCDMTRCGCNKPKPRTAQEEVDRCGCNKPKPRTMLEDESRCGCNKPKPRAGESDAMATERCGCNKPKPRTSEDMQDRCGCNKPKPKGSEADVATERCGCNKPKPRTSEDMQDRCGCNKPKPKTTKGFECDPSCDMSACMCN